MKNILKITRNATPLALIVGWLVASMYWVHAGTASSPTVALLAGTAAAIAWLFILNVNTIIPAHAVGAGITFWLTQSIAASVAFVAGIGVVFVLMAGMFIASSPTDLAGSNTPPTRPDKTTT